MNITETKAYNYLTEQGYKDIVFHCHSTPDFTTSTDNFEVKLLENNRAITIHYSQFMKLKIKPDIRIITFNNDNDKPIHNFPFSDILNGNYKQYGFKLYAPEIN